MNILIIKLANKLLYGNWQTRIFCTDRKRNEIYIEESNPTYSCKYKFTSDFLSYCYKHEHWLWEAYLIDRTIREIEFIESDKIKTLDF